MRLVVYRFQEQVAVGALRGNEVLDLGRAYRMAQRRGGGADPMAVAAELPPSDLQELLDGGDRSLAAARQALELVTQQRLRGELTGLWHKLEDVQLLPPIRRPGKVICVGLNYRSHLDEIGEPVPEYPILFSKPATSLVGHGKPIVLPSISQQVDYEGELAVVIGRRGKYIDERDALSHVAGYTCANDVSAHDIEFRTSQWTSGKMLDTFCPLGPALVTPDEVPDPGSLRLETLINGRLVQEACTSDMVFSVPFLISYVSSLATLEPGDVLLTGTPAGIGCNRNPPAFLRPGDEVRVQIEGVGTLVNPVIAESEY
jgi:acylpyruvate hydrolase